MTVANIMAGFEVMRVFPVNCDAFSIPALECESLAKQVDHLFP